MSRTIVSEVFQVLASGHGIVSDAVTLDLGNVCKTVYSAQCGEERLVVKLGIGERAAQEIQKNREGYAELRAIGAEALLPERLEYLEVCGIPLYVMSDCGLDFARASRAEANPEGLYTALAAQMRPVYIATRTGQSPLSTVQKARDNLVRQCTTHLVGKVSAKLVDRIKSCSFEQFADAQSCFSSFDFTPEDVFLTPRGVKYVDPVPGQLGIPSLDLACFAGVARDGHILPGAVQGYQVLEQFACTEVPYILGITESDAAQLFSLGRALQCALSARFRLQTDPARAELLAHMCEEHIIRCLR